MSSLQDKFNTITAEVIAWRGLTNAHALYKVLEQTLWELPKQWARDLKLWNYVTEPGLYRHVNKNSSIVISETYDKVGDTEASIDNVFI